ncbi:unnamed protein product [Tenebrio molitor]|jgi:uncharacterized Zn-finger protein|nr:unnamed protein product [Tenebrio molitor]
MDIFFPNNMCRTCVNVEENVVKIKNTVINCDNVTIPILDILNIFSDIDMNEDYPDSICSSCVERAAAVYKFKIQCDESNKIFRDIVTKICNREQVVEDQIVVETNNCSITNVTETKVVDDSEERKPQRQTKKAQKNKTDELERILFCHQCNKSFKNKYILSAHIKRHQYKGHFLCNVCGKGFNSQSCLTRHTRVHTGERNYECEICHKKFPSSNNLNLHSRTHSGIKPYLCTICGKSFSHPTGLTYHTRTHTKEKPYTCEVCGKSFAIQCHVDRHRKTHSGERPFPCKQCDKAFIKKIDLQRHEAVHSGLKPHVCTVCNKAFLRKMHLSYHMMVHTKERPHVCQICGKGFIRRYYLKDHVSKSHEAIGNYDVQGSNE